MMIDGQPSLTALGAAGHRAAHQLLEGGAIFRDPFARKILGEDACAQADARALAPERRPLRLLIAGRSRFAEEALASAVARGVRQAVALGAGLDTFALRNPHARQGLRVFEVDHPATQAWKRARLAAEGLAAPELLTFVPVDFQREDLGRRLSDCGFDAGEPAFFFWLGVLPYLPRETIFATLRYIASLGDVEVVFDYYEPVENYPRERRQAAQALAARVAALGEPLLSYFDTNALAAELRALGFSQIEDFDLRAIAARWLGAAKGSKARARGPHFLRARKTA
jgi:methyltransferase (TIGR00027 family)